MSRFTVWHNDSFFDFYKTRSVKDVTVRQAAVTDCDTLDEAYEKTNTIDRPWTENPEVKSVQTPKPRSTSVGDLIFDADLNKLFVVDVMGFREVTDEEHQSLNFETF